MERGLGIGKLRGIRREHEKTLIVERRKLVLMTEQQHGEGELGQPPFVPVLGLQDRPDQAEILRVESRVGGRRPLLAGGRERPYLTIRETDSLPRVRVRNADLFVGRPPLFPSRSAKRWRTRIKMNHEPARDILYMRLTKNLIMYKF